MQVQVELNIAAISAALTRRAEVLPSATAAGVDAAGLVVKEITIRQVQRIYEAEIPTKEQVAAHNGTGIKGPRSASSAPAWVRSGALLASIQQSSPDPFTAMIGIDPDSDAAAYAHRRHELGVSWMPANPATGVIRENPFLQEAFAITETQKDVVAKAFTAAFAAKAAA